MPINYTDPFQFRKESDCELACQIRKIAQTTQAMKMTKVVQVVPLSKIVQVV